MTLEVIDTFIEQGAALTVITNKPLALPVICVGCGRPTDGQMRIEVSAGDSKTELADVAMHAIGFVIPRSMTFAFCESCNRPLRRAKFKAIACVFGGLGLLASAPLMMEHVPMTVSMISASVAIMLILFCPILVYNRARGRYIPVHVSALSGGKVKYTFFNKSFGGQFRAFLDKQQEEMKSADES